MSRSLRRAATAAGSFLLLLLSAIPCDARAFARVGTPNRSAQSPAEANQTYFQRARSYAIGGKTINVYVGPPAGSGGLSLVSGIGGLLWFGIFTDRTYHPTPEIVAFSTKTFKSNVYPVPLSGEYPIVAGTTADGAHMWFTEDNGAPFTYGLLNANSFQQFLPSGLSGSAYYGVTGPTGVAWFGYGSGDIVSADFSGDVESMTALPGAPYEVATGFTIGSDGNVWYSNNGSNNSGDGVGKITLVNGKGVTTEAHIGSGANGLTAGPDGNIWFCANNAAVVGHVSTSGTGLETFSSGITGIPINIVTGPDKNLYFSEYNSSTLQAGIAQITTGGVVKEYTLPYGFVPYAIAVGADSNIWVLDQNHDQLGQLILQKKT
jgi:virginiamycin B lyase